MSQDDISRLHQIQKRGCPTNKYNNGIRQGLQNQAPPAISKTIGQIFKENICTLFNLFNVLIALALALVGAWSNMVFILIIALNTCIGIAQELHAKRLVDKLSLLSRPYRPCNARGKRTRSFRQRPGIG